MKKIFFNTLVMLSAINLCNAQLQIDCDQNYIVPNTTYSGNVEVNVTNSLVSSGIHTNSTTNVYKAGQEIMLIDGFEVVVASDFYADIDTCETSCLVNGMHAAFAEFDPSSFTIYLNGTNVVIETDGLPDHTSPYWSNTTERCFAGGPGGGLCTNSNTTVDHPLFVAPSTTTFAQMAPGNIDDFNGSYSLTVPNTPTLATSSSATGLGAIGFARSGSVIYNDEEGPNVPLDNAVGSLDYTAAHTGPQSYHYHLETKAWSDDDDKLIGIISDGFFIYGRKCNSTGTYPTDLDASGGHTSMTQHSCTAEYHYHIKNELYLGLYYILFPGDYQGTPNSIQ